MIHIALNVVQELKLLKLHRHLMVTNWIKSLMMFILNIAKVIQQDEIAACYDYGEPYCADCTGSDWVGVCPGFGEGFQVREGHWTGPSTLCIFVFFERASGHR
jgi:hypothetical protein